MDDILLEDATARLIAALDDYFTPVQDDNEGEA
jgi:hypothetical protein